MPNDSVVTESDLQQMKNKKDSELITIIEHYSHTPSNPLRQAALEEYCSRLRKRETNKNRINIAILIIAALTLFATIAGIFCRP
jgi:hypothetical protein